ncbi:hypothetical protein GPOL_c12150 [Gordonia polyisoprenivorans VH2]|uniref:Secreted protein n=1 Tax=Gordonia polyisoprenivorans (strain DSM 44266 / VH2) TaxID=1112204 RepID=H6N2G0_GORPV|nr:hypothetical protein [Gordonia polyisoprenivorans]AFA72273.1 hypothetical protein GPOL_c12150 [Gordonia polyisoprenivorans VH2]
MKTTARTRVPLASAMALAATLAVGAPALADTPAAPASLSIQGDLHLTPTIRVLRIDAQGSRTAGATTGTYTATLLDGMNPTPIQVRGPVTCISVDGNAASLIYPIGDIRPFGLPAAVKDAAAIQISVRKGVNGGQSMVGVNGPMPTGSFHGCAPAATPFAFEGTIQTSGG